MWPNPVLNAHPPTLTLVHFSLYTFHWGQVHFHWSAGTQSLCVLPSCESCCSTSLLLRNPMSKAILERLLVWHSVCVRLEYPVGKDSDGTWTRLSAHLRFKGGILITAPAVRFTVDLYRFNLNRNKIYFTASLSLQTVSIKLRLILFDLPLFFYGFTSSHTTIAAAPEHSHSVFLICRPIFDHVQ